jgi:hypothetical protein
LSRWISGADQNEQRQQSDRKEALLSHRFEPCLNVGDHIGPAGKAATR